MSEWSVATGWHGFRDYYLAILRPFQLRNPGDKRTIRAAVIYIGPPSIAQLASNTETSG